MVKTVVACCNGVLPVQEDATAAQGAKARLGRAEQALEALLDAQLARRMYDPAEEEENCSTNGDVSINFKDDYVDSDAPESNSDDGAAAAHHSCTGATHHQASAGQRNGGSQGASKEDTSKPAWEPVIDDSNPPSFSQVDLSRPESNICTRFPLFPVSPLAVAFLHTVPPVCAQLKSFATS